MITHSGSPALSGADNLDNRLRRGGATPFPDGEQDGFSQEVT
jgi:hypothetical protein